MKRCPTCGVVSENLDLHEGERCESSSGESNNAGNNSEADGVRSAPRQPSEPGGQGLAPLRSAPSPAPSPDGNSHEGG